jgi:hypothetical protein
MGHGHCQVQGDGSSDWAGSREQAKDLRRIVQTQSIRPDLVGCENVPESHVLKACGTFARWWNL